MAETTTIADLISMVSRRNRNPRSLLSDFDSARLFDLARSRSEDEDNKFIREVGDEDAPVLQMARTLVLCERYLRSGVTGSIIASNSAFRSDPTVVHNPDQTEDGRPTECSSFLKANASFDPVDLRELAVNTGRFHTFLKANVEPVTVIYISVYPFSVQNLDIQEHVPSILFHGLHVAAL